MEPLINQSDEILMTLRGLKESVEALSLTSRSEDLALKDYSLGLLAELGETRSKLLKAESLLEESQSSTLDLTEKLAREMKRAFEAERRAARLPILESELLAVYTSFTWKLGRFFMLPIRLLRRLQGR